MTRDVSIPEMLLRHYLPALPVSQCKHTGLDFAADA